MGDGTTTNFCEDLLRQAVPVAPEGAVSAPASPVKTKAPRKKAQKHGHDRTTGQREDFHVLDLPLHPGTQWQMTLHRNSTN